jgi:hypothetical protein
MPNAIEHASLVICVLNLLHFNNLRLFQDFDRIEAVIVLRLHEVDTSKTPRAKGPLNCEVIEGIFSLGSTLRPSYLGGILLRRVNDVVYAGGIAMLLVAGIRVCGSSGLQCGGLHGGGLRVGSFAGGGLIGLLLGELGSRIGRVCRVIGGLMGVVVVKVVVVVIVFGSDW